MSSPPQQIRITPDGVWHKRRYGNGRNATACGIHFPEELIPATREARLDDLICEACHSRHEIQTAEMKRIEREAIETDSEYVPLAKRITERIERRRARRDTDVDIDDKETIRELPPFPEEDE